MTRHAERQCSSTHVQSTYKQDEQARLSAEKEIRLLRLLQPCPLVVRCIDAVIRPGTTHNCQVRESSRFVHRAVSFMWVGAQTYVTSNHLNNNTKPKQLEALILMEHCSGGSLLELIRARATMATNGSRQQPVRFAREEILRVAEDVGRCVLLLLCCIAYMYVRCVLAANGG